MRVGLTGGIGSGKSTVSTRLAELGAVVIDADAIAREVVEPGTPGLAAVLERFGSAVAREDGTLDRAALAAAVFGHPDELQALNDILHPLIRRRSAELEAHAAPGSVVVHDIPLLVEGAGREGFDEVVVVMASESVRLERLAGRGLSEQDARDRMARQATDEQRRAVADVVLDNDGSREDLLRQVDELWHRWTGGV